MQESATGISWYRPDDYYVLRKIFADGGSLPQTYEQWLVLAMDLEKQVRRSGSRVIRAYLDPVEFPKWCRLTGNKIDASGRVAYGSAFAAETLSKEAAASNKKTKTWKIPVEIAADADEESPQ